MSHRTYYQTRNPQWTALITVMEKQEGVYGANRMEQNKVKEDIAIGMREPMPSHT